ncbi:acyl-CoA Delta(11) desaturase-like isoform X1 [Leptotrombidium deliense]|uniref:Acyl-CoA Delta(11) desaturase-like isoform X1 n=1 Tax=Leptotrombidium deliense TaxID=299467 RepID=A0A443SVS1_9ACAR|nr:acyl-CoA Delta(11) desaturase-like isoform X1 [Leptotrombidium deliense]
MDEKQNIKDVSNQKDTKLQIDSVDDYANEIVEDDNYQRKYRWPVVLRFVCLHLCALYGLYLSVTTSKYQSLVFVFVTGYLSGLGLTAGAHRLWSHKAYKAKWPLRLFLTFFNTMAFDDSIYSYVKMHRLHHKYAETVADPHNYNEGFWFSHYGWKMMTRHPKYLEMLKKQDLGDVLDDPFVRYQRKFYIPLVLICCFAIPTFIPFFCWNEDLITAFCICATFRWCVVTHAKATVNSLAHRWGQKPYDKTPGHACENKIVVWLAFGEGFHNFHHAFPWDYKQSELNWQYNMNLSAALIDFAAKLGLAYDLKKASAAMVEHRRKRTGEPMPENIEEPKKRSFCEWVISVMMFFFPIILWCVCRFCFNLVYIQVFGDTDKNIHNFILDFLAVHLLPHLQNYFEYIKSQMQL